jgi:hypothetical protein
VKQVVCPLLLLACLVPELLLLLVLHCGRSCFR